MSSADGMLRNLDKRVELMVPILDLQAKRRLQKMLKIYFKDNVKAHILCADGTYQRCRPAKGEPPFRSQRVLYEEAVAAVQTVERMKPTVLEPHRRRAAVKR